MASDSDESLPAPITFDCGDDDNADSDSCSLPPPVVYNESGDDEPPGLCDNNDDDSDCSLPPPVSFKADDDVTTSSCKPQNRWPRKNGVSHNKKRAGKNVHGLLRGKCHCKTNCFQKFTVPEVQQWMDGFNSLSKPEQDMYLWELASPSTSAFLG